MRLQLNSSRVHLDEFARRAGSSLVAGARVLDAGAGNSVYRRHFSHVSYEAADFLQVDKRYAQMDYVCRLDDIPVSDGRFDLVLLTQVLEHLPEPEAVLLELNRVLRHDGKLWLSAPLFYPEHEQPYDFYRYTRFGFSYLLERAGFEVESIDWLEGYHGTVAFQLDWASRLAGRGPSDFGGGRLGLVTALAVNLSRPILFILALLLYRSDVRSKYTARGYCKNYAIVAAKASPTPSS